jgi:prepilin-type N-terminal cleavage/methylation domain-containing protein
VSRWLESLRRRREARRRGQGGFTLIEIMVAITLVAIAAGGSIPLLIVGMQAANNSKLQTQAKNLAQQRFESMRDLPFHVDRQNGPFVDLLDIYYTSISTTSVTHTRAGETEVGRWVSGGAASPAPSGAFYQVTVDSISGYPSFSQKIDTQFLTVTGNALAASTFTAYDSQTEGRDQPPSLMVGVTVITTWNDHGSSRTYTSYTRISDSRGLTSALTTQGSAEFLRVSSAGSAGNALTVDLASADATGAQSTGSVAAADVRTLEAHDAAGTSYQGASAVATSPTGAVSQYPATMPLAGWTSGTNGSCGWVGAGPTQVTDVTAATASGLPKVPSDIDTATPPAHQAAAQITSGSNTACGIFGFANQSTSYDPNLFLAADVPLVRINNDSQNNVVVNSKAWVNATSAQASPHSVTSGANSSATKRVQVFPGAGFITDSLGLVDILLTSSTIACSSTVSSGSATQAATGSWSVTIDYWKATDTAGHGQRVSVPAYTWNSATGNGSADPLAALDPASIVVYQNGSTVLHLSDYIDSWSTARSITENPNSGVHQLDGIVSLSTQQVRAGDLMSAVGLQVGNLSCVADDNR